MLRLSLQRALLFGCACVAPAGCGNGSAGGADASTDSGVIVGGMDGGVMDGGGSDAGGLTTTIRLAHLSPDTGNVDLCYRAPNAQVFTGPVFSPSPTDAGAGEPDAGDSGTSDADGGSGQDAAADAPVDAPPGGDAAPDSGEADAGGDAASADGSASDGEAEDGGGPPGLAYLHVSAYAPLRGAGTFDLAIVAAGQGSCTAPIVEARVTLDAGKQSTVVLLGLTSVDGGPQAAAVVAFTDDRTVASESTRTRFIHAALGTTSSAPEGPLQAGIVTGTTTIPFAATILPQQAATPGVTPAVDVLGYHTDGLLAAPQAVTLGPAADAGGAAWTGAPSDLGLEAASVHTAFVVSDPQGALAVLWCSDTTEGNQAPTCVTLH